MHLYVYIYTCMQASYEGTPLYAACLLSHVRVRRFLVECACMYMPSSSAHACACPRRVHMHVHVLVERGAMLIRIHMVICMYTRVRLFLVERGVMYTCKSMYIRAHIYCM